MPRPRRSFSPGRRWSREFIDRKCLTATTIRPTTATGRDHPPPLLPNPLMQQVLMKVQLMSNIGNAPIPVDHTMRCLGPVLGAGAPRTRPTRVRADKAYSSRAIRTELRRRGITAVIAEPSDQVAHRKRRGSCGCQVLDIP